MYLSSYVDLIAPVAGSVFLNEKAEHQMSIEMYWEDHAYNLKMLPENSYRAYLLIGEIFFYSFVPWSLTCNTPRLH